MRDAAASYLPATVGRSLTRMDQADRRTHIGRILHPTARSTSSRPVGTMAASRDYFDRLGGSVLDAVRRLTGQPGFRPTQPGLVERSPFRPPSGPPADQDFSARALDRTPQSLIDRAQAKLDGARGALERMDEEEATSQAEILALQQQFQDANRMFQLATTVVKARHDVQKSMLRNIRV